MLAGGPATGPCDPALSPAAAALPARVRPTAGCRLVGCSSLAASSTLCSVAIRVFWTGRRRCQGCPWSWPRGICGPPRTPAEKPGTWSVSEDTSHVSKHDKAREIQPSFELGLFWCHAAHKLRTLGCNFLF
jgi:hypothetical protein